MVENDIESAGRQVRFITIDKHEQAIEIINSLTPEIVAEKGRAARQRAIEKFQPQKWFEAIIA